MTDTLFSDLRSAEALQTYVLETGPVLTLRLDSQERVVEANALALRLFGEEIVGRPLADLIAHCSGSFALDWPALGDGRISRLTFKTVSQMPETLYFRFFPLQTGALALGSIDFDEQQKLLAGLEALNAELSGLARQLQQANAELRDLSEFKTRAVQKMQEDNEALRRQGLASLNLMEDALESRERAEKANHALRESEQQFRSLVEGAPDTIFVVTDLVISYINPAGCRLFGASSPEQLLNQPVFDRIHPSSQDQVRARIHKVFHQKEPASSSEQLWITLDGTLVPLEVSSVPITYRGKDSALTYARDLSERHRAKEELRRSEDRYRSILEAAPDAIVMLNADGKIVLVNSQAESMFGYSREALLGRDSASLFAKRYRHLHLQRRELFFENSLNQPQGAVVENFGLRADGTEFPIEYRTSPLEDQDGKRQLAVFRDVTERRDSEQRSRQL